MAETCVVISDIHVGDGTRAGDQFFQHQQEALDGLLAALGAIFAKSADRSTHLAGSSPIVQNMFLWDAQVQTALPGQTHLGDMMWLPGKKLVVDTRTWIDRLFQPAQYGPTTIELSQHLDT